MVAKLLPLIERRAHTTYVEPFGGGASLLLAKNPSPVEVYNDLDHGLVSFFRVLREPAKFARFYHLASLTPYAREEFEYCRETWEDVEDEVERAYRWFIVARMSFSGNFGGSWSNIVTLSRRDMAATCSKWLSILEELPQIADRMMQVQIENSDFRKILDRFDTPEVLFYADPPYIPDTRASGKYQHEITVEDHHELVEILLNIQGQAILSGYPSDVYAPLQQAGWVQQEWATACTAAGRTRATGIQGTGMSLEKQARTEVVWATPPRSNPLGIEL